MEWPVSGAADPWFIHCNIHIQWSLVMSLISVGQHGNVIRRLLPMTPQYLTHSNGYSWADKAGFEPESG